MSTRDNPEAAKRFYERKLRKLKQETKAQESEEPREPKKPGRKPHEPDEKKRNQVKFMVATGLYEYQIAKIMGIDQKTLHKYYPDELDVGLADITWKIGAKLVQTALSDKKDALEAQKFFLTRRTDGLWSERKSIEVSGPNGGAIPMQSVDMDAFSYDDLVELERLIAPAIIEGEFVDASDDEDGDENGQE